MTRSVVRTIRPHDGILAVDMLERAGERDERRTVELAAETMEAVVEGRLR